MHLAYLKLKQTPQPVLVGSWSCDTVAQQTVIPACCVKVSSAKAPGCVTWPGQIPPPVAAYYKEKNNPSAGVDVSPHFERSKYL